MNKMKVPTVAAIAAIALTACGKADGGLSGEAITLDSLLTVAEAYVGDTITLRGIAVQKEGAPLYVTDSAKTNKLRIERTEGCSTDEVVEGDAMCVRGILREERTTKNEILAKEAEADSLRLIGVIAPETFGKIKNLIAAKKAYLEFTGRDYYSEYYMVGTEIETE